MEEESSSKTYPVAFQSLRAVLLLLLEAAAALALVEYVRRELPALGAGAADAARRATRHRDTCELTAITASRAGAQHRPLFLSSFLPAFRPPPAAVPLRAAGGRRFRSSRRAVGRPPPVREPLLPGSAFTPAHAPRLLRVSLSHRVYGRSGSRAHHSRGPSGTQPEPRDHAHR